MLEYLQKKFQNQIVIETTRNAFEIKKRSLVVDPSDQVVKSPSSPGNTRSLKKINQIISQPKVNVKLLRSVSWKGLTFTPSKLHAEVWKYLLGYYPSDSSLKDSVIQRKRREYVDKCMIYDSFLRNPKKNMNENELKVYEDIRKDVPRTMQQHNLFRAEKISQMMTRLLYVWSMGYIDSSSYIQGFSDLCTPFFILFINEFFPDKSISEILNIDEESLYSLTEENFLEIESDVYWCFTEMMKKIHNNYINIHSRVIERMEEIVKFVDIDLYNLLEKTEVKFVQFAFRWINCYMMREFNIFAIIRLWDSYFSEESDFTEFHLYVCACLLLSFSDTIKQMKDFQEIIIFLQNLPTMDWEVEKIEVLVAKAYQTSMLYSQSMKRDIN